LKSKYPYTLFSSNWHASAAIIIHTVPLFLEYSDLQIVVYKHH